MNFKNKIALISGASRGIGRAIAEIFAMKGATVIGTATNQNGVKQINSYLNNNGKGMELNVSNQNSINHVIKTINIEFGDIDILINNAGVTNDNILIMMKENEWQNVIDTNLTSIYRMSKIVIKSMIKQRFGRIITIGSVIGSIGNMGQTNYAAAKSGLIGFSKSLAREVASKGITVNIIAPGFIETDMTKNLKDQQREKILSYIPMNRLGKPYDIAYVTAFIASDEASYITGETINVNGGLYMS